LNEAAIKRLFFALWPDDALKRKIKSTLKHTPILPENSRLVPAYNLHLTLHFLGNVPLAKIDCFKTAAANIPTAKFSLNLNHIGCFNKVKVLWLGVKKSPPELIELHKKLGKSLSACGYAPEARTFKPHITLARKVKVLKEKTKIKPLIWQVNRFALIESIASDRGVLYKPLKVYSL